MGNSNDFEMFGYFFKRYKWRKGNVLKRENIKIITCSKTNNLVKTIFNYFPLEYQKSLFEKMRGSDFYFDCIHKTYYSCHKMTLKKSRS